MEKLKLLVIEDDIDQRELICETLEDYFGANTVVGVGSRAEAMTQDLGSFDLILSDYNLPDCTGMELLEKIQASCQTPVIMVTGENVGQIAAEAIRKGASDYVVKFGDYMFTIPLTVQKNLVLAKVKRENETLRQDLQRALTEVQDKNRQLETSLKRVEELAATDPLTGLYNRRHFGKVVEQLFSEAQRYGKDLACVMVDLDEYKSLNDTFGHQIGDELLMRAGQVISANMRRMDIAARYGGDEFILLLPHASSEEAANVAQRIRQEFFQATTLILKRPKGVTMSIGVGSIGVDCPAHAENLVARADAALYKAKELGRNRIVQSDQITLPPGVVAPTQPVRAA